MIQDVNVAVSVSFQVKLDDQDLGEFSSCEGLGCEVVLETREEGGNNGFTWQLPTKLRYPNIKLTRPLGRDTEKIVKWLSSIQTGYTRRTGTIVAMRGDGKVIATWGLLDVVPVRWSGPSLNSDQAKVVTETVEIAHHGFITTGQGA
ncbi:phage tail protein [Humibacillus sp. DSM 29435]|uniref:phage tail protein n=1 Tax=Humibacillus sp. DSM 29435 TaxID=1869167 RepID=UPI000871C8E9|nr:phage tail protein [Humibacillus sp. DSM 29435]OFE15409.1 phage tail protein [Humibacillus sp. DSM 29435]